MIVLGEHRFSPLAADVHQLSAEPQFGHHIRRKYAEIPEDVMSLKTRRRLVFNVSHPDCERNAEFVRERLPISMQATIIHTNNVDRDLREKILQNVKKGASYSSACI